MEQFWKFMYEFFPIISNNLTAIVIGGIIVFIAVWWSLDNTR